jgi:hypothetical protein
MAEKTQRSTRRPSDKDRARCAVQSQRALRWSRDGAAGKVEIRAKGTETAKRILKDTEKYVEDSFASHGRKIQAAIKAYRDKNGKDSVTVEVEATIRLGYGSGPTRRHESRARVIVKDDPPSQLSMDETPSLIDLCNSMASLIYIGRRGTE